MKCTARAEDNVEIKFVRRVENEDIDDINEDAKQGDYTTALLTRMSSLDVVISKYFHLNYSFVCIFVF